MVQEAAEYPIAPKEHGVEFLMDNRHLWVRSNRQWAILRVRATIVKAHTRLAGRSRLYVGRHAHPDAQRRREKHHHLFETDYIGEPAYLTQIGPVLQRGQHHGLRQGLLLRPDVPRGKSKTRRHLHRVLDGRARDAFCKLEDLSEIEEQFIGYIVQTTLRKREAELKVLERDLSCLERVMPPFPRLELR